MLNRNRIQGECQMLLYVIDFPLRAMRNFSVKFILHWIFFWPFVQPQGCDPNSTSSQCPDQKFCRDNYCESALSCDTSSDCITKPGTFCVADYCQLEECTASGQCVHRQVCSKDTMRKCVYRVTFIAEESGLALLSFPKPGTEGKYEEIAWFKDASGSLKSRIALVHPDATKGKPYYYNDYCSESSPCETSEKGQLNLDTGGLTINKVQLSDEGYYYYRFYNDGGKTPDTGIKYDINIKVYVKPKQKDLLLEGITKNVTIGDVLYLSCTVNRIRPKALDIYFSINGRRIDGTLATENRNGTFRQTSVTQYIVTEHDDGKPIQCIVVPQFGNKVEVEQILTLTLQSGDKLNEGSNNAGVIVGVVVSIIIIISIISIVVLIFFYKKYGKDYRLCMYHTFAKNAKNKPLKKKKNPVITVANNPGYVNWNEYEVNDDAGAGARSDTDVMDPPVVEETTTTQKELTEVDHTPRAQNSFDKTFDENTTTEEEAEKEKDKSVQNSSYQNTIAKVQGHNNDIVDINYENEIEGSSKTESEYGAVEVELNARPNHEYDEVYEGNEVQSDTNENVRNRTMPNQNYDEVSFENTEDANQNIHENNEDVNSNRDSHSVEIHDTRKKDNDGSESQPEEDSDCYADVEAPSPTSTTEKDKKNKSSGGDKIQWMVNNLYEDTEYTEC